LGADFILVLDECTAFNIEKEVTNGKAFSGHPVILQAVVAEHLLL